MIMNYKGKQPKLHGSSFIADGAVVIGDVTMEEGASIWFQSVVRGDSDHIHIGCRSNIQDNVTLHTDINHQIRIGNDVTIGHNAVIHGAEIEDECLIGMGAVILNGAHIGTHCIIGAGTLVKESQVIESNCVVVGNPARVIKQIRPEQVVEILSNAQHYVALAETYKAMQEEK